MKRLATLLVSLMLATATHAAPVTYGFSGTVTQDDAERGLSTFSGSFRFDSAAADTVADSQTAAYAHSGAAWRMSVMFDGNYAFTINDQSFVLITNDVGGEDQFGVLALAAYGESLQLQLWDFAGLVFGNDKLPTAPLTLAAFSDSLFAWDGAAGRLAGRLDSLTCLAGCEDPPTPEIPEPGTVPLVLAAAAAALLRPRRRDTK